MAIEELLNATYDGVGDGETPIFPIQIFRVKNGITWDEDDYQLFAHNVEKAINGEYSAITCYEKLSRKAPSNEEKEKILEIRKDEIKHFRTFSEIYTTLTGSRPTPRMVEDCPERYCEGLKAAFKDEQNTVDFYLDIADKADETFIKERFKRAAADEQNHAVWFSFFYTTNNDK
jgi:rubrerythrin